MSETITGDDNTANYNQNESIKYDENKTVFNDHKIVENVPATTKLLQTQTAPPTTTIIMLDEPTTNNDNINYKEYDSSDSYDEFDDYMNDHDDGDDDDDDDDDEDNNQNDTMENNADDHQDDEDDDDDDQDYSFIDDMLEENVDVEAIKRSDEMKPNAPIRNNHRQYKKLKRKFPQKKFTNRLNKKSNKKRKSRIETKEKNILVKRGHDLFEILPEGWVEISHFSGMPIYLDKRNRVCTLSKPYHLGTGSARKHHIPLSAIPCLQYRTELEKERKAREELELKLNNTDNNNNNDTNDNNDGNDSNKCDDNENTICNNAEIQNNNDNDNTNSNSNDNDNNNNNQTIQQSQPKLQQSIAKVETLIENKKERSLDANKIREYCQRLFEFKTVTVKKFTNWADRRKHEQSKKLAQRPSLPESTKLITCTVPKIANVDGQDNDQLTCVKPFKKEFIMNPVGKSDICILHEYVQHTERTQPKYVFQELENVSKPYCAIVYINEMEYGKGYGSSKKEAKTEAARASLDILIPDLKNTLNQEQNKNETLNDLKFFDEISIDDQRVSELCWKTGQYSPYQILVECIKRLHGFEEMDIKTETRIVKHQKIEFKMTAGTHEAVVICKNKREGKQLAAQKILRSIHPQFKCWGALLKLYGQGSCKTSKEKKEEAQKITELQNNACSNKPNYAILNKLKEEMLKLHDENGKQEQQQLRSSLPAILNATIVGQQQQQQQQAEKHRQPYHHNHHYRKNNKYNYINNYKIVRKNNYQKKS